MKSRDDLSVGSLIPKLIIGGIIGVVGLVFVANSVTTVGADEIVVKQNFVDGQLQVWTSPGVHWQNFGRLTRYKKSSQYWFSAKEDEGKKEDDSIKVRFNDGGHSMISGSLRYNLPLDPQKMIKLHSTYGSMSSIDHELVKQVVNKSVYMTGPLMSSRESYAEKRADLINFITDQILHGVYKTQRKQTETIDPVSGQKKTVDLVEPKLGVGPNGIEREEESPIDQFGLYAYNITINGIDYDPQVEEQIKQQQQAIMAVQQAMVDAKKAEQAAITTEQQGKAEAAKAKWAQEVEKAKAVTAAEQQKEVAALTLQTSKLEAERTMTEAKASSDARKLAIQADNALQTRLDAYVKVQTEWAKAFGAHRQTPDIQLGGSSSSTTQLMDFLAAKAARDLNVTTKP
jgi:regulator of protease activity HflC (stomatin/prohibitin superfamily)